MKEAKHLILLAKRILIVFLAYTLCRILFLMFNFQAFGGDSVYLFSSFLYGLRFDASAIIYINSLFILLHLIPFNFRDHRLYQSALLVLFIVTNSIAILFNIIDFEYYKFSGQRSGSDFFAMSDDFQSMQMTYIVSYWYLILIFSAFCYLLFKLYQFTLNTKKQLVKQSIRHYTTQSLWLIISIPVIVILMRGGLQFRPINSADAARHVPAAYVPLVLNTPFHMIRTWGNTGLKHLNYFNQDELEGIYKAVYEPAENMLDSNFESKNVVIIILESFSREYMGFLNDYEGYTPFLDSLSKSSLFFKNAFANGTRSIEGIPAIISGMPSWMQNAYSASIYQTNQIKCIGKHLSEKGYQTSFYHGGHNGTMGFDRFLSISNYGEYYGLNEYPYSGDYDGNWGIFDEPYLSYFADQLNAKNTPFMSTVFLISSHHPYTIPEAYKEKLPQGSLPIHRSIRYSDYALKRFFEKASSMPWYEETLFIITSDHTAESEIPIYQNSYGRYAIPLLFFHPNGNFQGISERTAQHIDILPSILSYTSHGKKAFAFGNDLLNPESEDWALQFIYGGIYQFIRYPYILHFDGESVVSVFNHQKDPFLRENMKNVSEDTKLELTRKLKAIIQTYHAKLINNSLIINETSGLSDNY